MVATKTSKTATEAELEKLRKENELLKKENTELVKKVEVSQHVGDKGWLVISPNPSYKGITLGIAFNRGMAFIPEKSKPSAGMIKGKSTSVPNPAKFVAEMLRNDFGYKIVYVDGTEEATEKMRAMIEERDNEFREAMQQMERSKVEKILPPGYLGQ